MGLLNGVLGNASRIDNGAATTEYGYLLSEGEQVLAAYRLIRDALLFTTTRLIIVNRQGLTGKKKIYFRSVPYRAISNFAVETAGTFDLDAELNVWVIGRPAPFELTFSRGVDVFEVQGLLAKFVAG